MSGNSAIRQFRNSAMLFSLFCLALFATTAGAQLRPVQPPQSSDRSYSAAGIVVNSVSGEPIARAMVDATSPQGGAQSMLSDAEGRFRFDHLPAGTLYLSAQRPGYKPPSGRPQSVEVGGASADVILKLLPLAVVAGRVTDARGEPIEGAYVRISQLAIRNGRRHIEQRGGASTDDEGNYRAANLDPGRYYVAVTSANFSFFGRRSPINPRVTNRVNNQGNGPANVQANPPTNDEQGYPAITYYPGVADAAAAAPLQVGAGERVQVDFSLRIERVFRISGMLTGFARNTGVSVRFSNASGDELPFALTRNGPDGAFEIRGVPAGQYIARFHANDAEGHPLQTEFPLTVAGDVSGVHVALQPAIAIPINVETQAMRAEDAAASANLQGPGSVRGRPNSALQFVSVRLLAVDGRNDELWATLENLDKTTPRLTLRDLRPGRYTVELNSNMQPWYVASATCGSVDVLRQELVIAPGSTPPPIQIVLRDDAATLAASVQAAGVQTNAVQNAAGQNNATQPDKIPRFMLLAIPESAPAQGARILASGTVTDTQRIELQGLAPGDYSLLALDNADGIEFSNADALRPYLSHATHATLYPNTRTAVTLEVVHTAPPEGTEP